jgi:hypothetical protein
VADIVCPMTVIVDVATHDDISEILASADALVATDAGRYDPGATNLGWAARTGLAYCMDLLDSADNLVLLARDGDRVVGHLVARLSGPGSVHPILVAGEHPRLPGISTPGCR